MLKLADHDVGTLPAQQTTRQGPRKSISHEVVSGTVQVLDFLTILLAGPAAFSIYVASVLGNEGNFDQYGLTGLVAAIAFVSAMRKTRGYTFRHLSQLRWQIGRTLLIWAATISMLSTIAFLTKMAGTYSRGWAVVFAAVALVELAIIRIVLRLLILRWKRQGLLLRTIAVVGAGQVGEQLITKLKAAEDTEVTVAGVFDDRLTRIPPIVAGSPVLGTTDHLVAFAQTSHIDEIIVALPLRAADRIGQIINKLRLLPVDLRLSIDPIAGAFPMRGISETASVRVLEILDRPLKHWSGVTKWLEDKALSILCLIAFGPLMAFIALAIRLDSKGPILFVQDRFGFNNRPVRVLKFRTMHVEKSDPSGAVRTVPNDPRVTRVGRILRRLSLDELPQLLNVLRGDMSLVGPRPHALAMKAGDRLYHDAVGEYFHRHRVRPGMSGWAQVHGLRGEIDSVESARERVSYDLYYIDNWSLWLDVKILVMTLRVLLLRKNAY